jgi:hypothetical protein
MLKKILFLALVIIVSTTIQVSSQSIFLPEFFGVYVLDFGGFNGTLHAVRGGRGVYAFSITGDNND